MMKRPRWTSIGLLALGAIALSGLVRAETPTKSSDRYVVLVKDGDQTIQAIFDRYPELKGSWEDLATYNLVRSGHPIEIPSEMLATDGYLAKVGSFYGEAEVKRAFDSRYVPVLTNLLLREGDEIRTWGGSGVRILFDDGNYVFVKSHSRAKLVSLGTKKSPASSRLQIFLKEGSVWSQMENAVRGRFEVHTATASTIIRGTEFRVKVEPGEATRVEVLEGRVDFETGERRLSVGRQEGVVAVPGTDAALAPARLPSPPTLEGPLPEEVIRSESFDQVFRWSAANGADLYLFEIARDDRFFDVVVERRVAEPEVRIQSLEPGTYFWRAASVLGGFESSPAESRYFVFVDRRP